MDAPGVATVRRFSRIVTQRLGALNDEYLARPRPLGASRVLYEIGEAGADARTIRSRLGLDSGYLSRMWVSPSVRGLSLGRRMLRELERAAAEGGVTAVRLETNERLIEAIGLYRSSAIGKSPPSTTRPTPTIGSRRCWAVATTRSGGTGRKGR